LTFATVGFKKKADTREICHKVLGTRRFQLRAAACDALASPRVKKWLYDTGLLKHEIITRVAQT